MAFQAWNDRFRRFRAIFVGDDEEMTQLDAAILKSGIIFMLVGIPIMAASFLFCFWLEGKI